jgi:hypothetical protein
MPNYAGNAATAKRMINGAGRTVTLVALDFDTPDPATPWRGVANPRQTPAKTLALKMVVVSVAAVSALGFKKTTLDLAKKANMCGMIATQEKLDLYQELIDSKDGRRYKIVVVEDLAPGSISILQFLVLNQ